MMMMMIESWPQRGGVIGDGYLFWHPSFFFFFLQDRLFSFLLVLWSTNPSYTHTHMGLFYICIYIGTLALYILGIMRLKKEKREGGGGILLVLLLHRLFFFFFLKKKKYSRHTHTHTTSRAPGRYLMGPHVVGFDRVLLVGAVPSSESFFFFSSSFSFPPPFFDT